MCIVCPHFKIYVPLIESNRYCQQNVGLLENHIVGAHNHHNVQQIYCDRGTDLVAYWTVVLHRVFYTTVIITQ